MPSDSRIAGRSVPRTLAARAALCLTLLAPWAQAQQPAPAEDEAELFALEAPAVRAMLEQAVAAEGGRGQRRSAVRASLLYCEAAAQGSGEAQYRLGLIYAGGRGQAQDRDIAATLFSMAAGNGHQAALVMLESGVARPEKLPLCLQDPEAAWKNVRDEMLVDIDAYVDALPKARRRVAEIIRRLAPQFAVDTRLALAVASVESNFDALARSPKNAVGVMQLIPETAARFAVNNVRDPEQNIRGGLAYLRWLLARFRGDGRLAVAAYNAGEGNVERYHGVPPYAETRSYVRRITQYVDLGEDAGTTRRLRKKTHNMRSTITNKL